MRLHSVEVCGFRGFRDKLHIAFGAGFTILSGRNGVGKSTLCDAVEFALTGKIDKYKVETSAKESISDYLWWRGDGTPAAHYVTTVFIQDDGTLFDITRTRETGSNRTDEEVRAVLCSGPAPDDALIQLCKTSIIRDEWIAALSLDLTETERFELVRSALGAVEGADFGGKAKDVLASAEASQDKSDKIYEAARGQLADRLTQLSEAQDAAARAGDVAAAMQVLSAVTQDGSSDLLSRLAAGRRMLADRRARLGPMGEAVQMGREVSALRQAFGSPDNVQRRSEARQALANATVVKETADNAVADAKLQLAREEQADAVAASLTLLVEHGERLGLHDDHCPLCAAARTHDQFAAGLAIARARIETLASGVSQARDALRVIAAAAEQRRQSLAAAQAQAAAFDEEEARLRAREEAHVEFLGLHDLGFQFAQDADGLEHELLAERDRLINLERALLTLEASQAVSRIAALEDQVAALRTDVDSAADLIAISQAAVASAKVIERAVRRVSAEIIDERLAQISPLLNELYQRLRPHAAWRTIDYRVRGDVRRFLSLKVGNDLNPQFVFSSGQRRAAGLAFLLSVHLARAWTPWRTLLLDDPVQHIDDFRALQLVEVLAAFRLDRRQIICAVEDADLADLLCRRLPSTAEEPGRRYDIDLGPDGAAVVAVAAAIPPMAVDVLRRGSGLQAVS
ncbi:AAA family ATPase [Mesorhizobium sp. AR07]|nr:AAA family ATPase [Mesorhizobium sp. AR07]